jgi:hypothetical protein
VEGGLWRGAFAGILRSAKGRDTGCPDVSEIAAILTGRSSGGRSGPHGCPAAHFLRGLMEKTEFYSPGHGPGVE